MPGLASRRPVRRHRRRDDDHPGRLLEPRAARRRPPRAGAPHRGGREVRRLPQRRASHALVVPGRGGRRRAGRPWCATSTPVPGSTRGRSRPGRSSSPARRPGSRNADAILAALSEQAGDFVVTVAGPNAEAQIAGRGSGVARWSADHYEQVTIGRRRRGDVQRSGLRPGPALCSSALAVGGRQVEIDAAGAGAPARSPGPGPGRTDLGLPLREGQQATLDQLRGLCEAMADLIADLAQGRDVGAARCSSRRRCGARSGRRRCSSPVASGRATTAGCRSARWRRWRVYGDVGPLLADAIHRNERTAGA